LQRPSPRDGGGDQGTASHPSDGSVWTKPLRNSVPRGQAPKGAGPATTANRSRPEKGRSNAATHRGFSPGTPDSRPRESLCPGSIWTGRFWALDSGDFRPDRITRHGRKHLQGPKGRPSGALFVPAAVTSRKE